MSAAVKEKPAAPRRVQKAPKHTGRRLLLVLIVLFAVIAVLLFGVNRMSLDVTLNGSAEQTLEYGTKYQEEGASALLRGTLLFKEGLPAEVEQQGTVDSTKLGTYTITYSARKFLWSGKAERLVTVQDTTPPEITLTSDPEHYTLPGQAYEEEGYTALDSCDGDLTAQVERKEKDGVVTYTVSDASGNQTTVKRTIKYDDPIPPELHLKGNKTITIQAGSEYSEPGWTAEDNVDGNLSKKVKVSGSVDTYSAGTYTLRYSVKDGYGNKAKAKRTVVVEPVRQPDTVKPDGKIIYLTFDDGPGPYTQELLDVLARYNVKVTFFTCNTGYDSLMAKEAAAGHTVANHTATHKYDVIYSSESAFFKDFNAQQDRIYKNTGIHNTLLRFPGGSSNTTSRKYCSGIMTALTKSITDQGYQYFDWNVLSGDAGDTTSTDQVFQNVIAGVQKQDISVVLQHDIHHFSVQAVERIIIWGLAHGYTFLPLTSSSPAVHHSVLN